MNKIFKDKKEPLFGRQTDQIRVRAFAPSVMKEIMAEYAPDYSKEDLLTMYMLTGGVAKYVELLVDKRNLTKEKMIDAFFEEDGKIVLMDYKTDRVDSPEALADKYKKKVIFLTHIVHFYDFSVCYALAC